MKIGNESEKEERREEPKPTAAVMAECGLDAEEPSSGPGGGPMRGTSRSVATWPKAAESNESSEFVLTTIPVKLPREWFVTGPESCLQGAAFSIKNRTLCAPASRFTEVGIATSMIVCLVTFLLFAMEMMFWISNG